MKFAVVSISAALFAFAPMCQAGILEDLLAVPAIQSLLGRASELQATVQKCADAKYKQKYAVACQQAEQANRLAKLPPELRAVLAAPPASASLREICLGVQSSPVQYSYLCAELGKADTGFKTQMDQKRQANELAEMQKRANSGGAAENNSR